MKIALTFSGGGYRAASFSLGTLSLLNELSFAEGSFLDSVEVLSTVSGGTITGSRYAISLKRGESFDQFYSNIFLFLSDAKLIELALSRLSSEDNWQQGRVRSLVSAFADVYDSELFDQSLFGELMDEKNPKGIKHLSFNATEFANGLQFRFQWSEKMIAPDPGEAARGIIGNNYYNIPEIVAREIRMADIMAASSCFPGGFEPINFPSDFVLPKGTHDQLPKGAMYPVGLMDGGVVDNQGIDPVMLATGRIYRNHVKSGGDEKELNQIDLVIVSDVASPNMDDFKASHEDQRGWWKGLTARLIINLNWLLFLLALSGFGFSVYFQWFYALIFSTIGLTISLLLLVVFKLVSKLIAGIGIPEQFLKPLGMLKKMKLYVYQSLVLNRVQSLMMLTTDVFLKHVRRLNYNTLYRDKRFVNRRIMNAVYELTSDQASLGKKILNGTLPAYLMPSAAMQKNSDQAASMGTTLWFSPSELKDRMLESLVACGQYTACWNLLEYIELLKNDSSNTNENHAAIMMLEDSLKSLWKEFQLNPFYLIEKTKLK